MRVSRLHTKFLVLILGTLIIFLAAGSYYIVRREAALLERKAEERQEALTFAIYSNLKDNMIQGTPRSTARLMNSIRGTYGVVRLDTLKRDGTSVFGVSGTRVAAPEVETVFSTGKEMSYHETAGVPVHTILYPLKNEGECIGCHGSRKDILGVLLISLSLEDTVREIQKSKRKLALSLAALILVIGGVLYCLVRKVVLQPLAILYDGAERIGRGDLSHRIALSTNDEIQELGRSFNVMAGSLEQSYGELESRIRERTAQLSNSVIDVRDKARKLYEYGRDLATISRLSRKVFNAEQSLDKLLDQCMWAVSRGLGYNKALFFLVDRKRAWLELKRDSGLGELLYIPDQSLAGQEPFAGLVRAGRAVYVEDTGSDPVFNRYRRNAFPELPALHVIPVLSGTRNNKCWDILGCVKTDCPAYARHDLLCWMVENTLCRNSLVESYGDKLAYCMSCQIFPVLGVLVVGARPVQGFPKRDVSVLRILAAQMGAAIENHRLYDANRQMIRDLIELHKATASALADLSLERALEAFVKSAVKLSSQDACNFWLLSKDGRELVRKAGICLAAGVDMTSFPERVPVDAGVLGAAYRRNSVVTEYRAANDGTRLGEVLGAQGLVSLLAVPLTSEGRPIGVFSIHKKSSTPFIENEIAAFLLVANHAALAVNVCILNEEMKNRNRELSGNISLIEGILASISSGVMLVDMTGTVQLINQAGAALLNMRPGDMLKRPLADLFPEAAVFFDSSIGPYQETEVLLSDGSKVPIGFSNTYYRGPSGEDEGVIIIYRDLTEIKSLRREVLTKERFAAMGRVVDGVAHEIRNPLFGISSIGQIFERELRDPAHRKLAGALISETKRLNRLVEELLIYGRPMKLQLTKCDVMGLWEDAVQMSREEMDSKGISILGESGVLHIHAYLDAHQMKQVFLNLLRNAIDSMPAGGEISMTLLLEDRYIILTIADTGQGIPAGDMDKVFDLFFTTKPKGTGLGLGICKKIIEDHGGEISIRRLQESQTEKQRGTAVTIKLPYKGQVERGRKNAWQGT